MSDAPRYARLTPAEPTSVTEVLDAIVAGESASPGFAEGVRVQRVLEAVKASAATGRGVRVEMASRT